MARTIQAISFTAASNPPVAPPSVSFTAVIPDERAFASPFAAGGSVSPRSGPELQSRTNAPS
jgi:hypothetical protein